MVKKVKQITRKLEVRRIPVKVVDAINKELAMLRGELSRKLCLSDFS